MYSIYLSNGMSNCFQSPENRTIDDKDTPIVEQNRGSTSTVVQEPLLYRGEESVTDSFLMLFISNKN